MRRICLSFLLLFYAGPLFAQQTWFLRDRPYYDPLTAEPRAAQMTFLFPAVADGVPFAANEGRSLAWDISLGREIPIVGWDNSPGTADDGVGPGKFGIGLWFPASFHMIEDMSKDESAPILNTDYRFGMMLKAQYGLPRGGRIGLRFVPWFHESTHIGDEFTLAALRVHGNQFQRVNVSYEYWELGGSYEDGYLQDEVLTLKFRGGFLRLWDQDKGWYNAELLQPSGETLFRSNRNYEPYLGFEAHVENAFGENKGFFTSLDLRSRTVYGYDRSSSTDPEETQWSVNSLTGVRHARDFGGVEFSYFFRFYYGVNPAGQFRSQQDYRLLGVGMLFDF